MKGFKGTKGEWKMLHSNYWCEVQVHRLGNTILSICAVNNNVDEYIANAKLIASAPQLIEALLSIENDNGSIPKAIWDLRNKAISKALD